MKKKVNLAVAAITVAVAALTVTTISCKKKSDTTPTQTPSYFTQTNLVADTAGFNAVRIDPNIQDAWGMAVNPTGVIWITSNGPGTSLVYDTSGNQKIAPVTIPAGASNTPGTLGTPSGMVYNTTTGFVLANSEPAKFIFVTEDGTISAWNGGAAATLIVDSSASGAVFKGLAIAPNNYGNYLYVANFEQHKVDVYNSSFKYDSLLSLSTSFNDPGIPSNYGPFNVQYIGGLLYVVYAKIDPNSNDDLAGAGNGYISIFTTNGEFVQAPATFGTFANDFLVSNFGDGTISVFDVNGNFKGQLENTSGNVISIDGIWGLLFPVNGDPAVNLNRLYFTAGPDDENHGLFGYLTIN